MTEKPKVPAKNILLVEDDPNLGTILQESLELQDFSVTLCEDGEAGLASFVKNNFDLCLVDVMLPKKDGFTLAQDIRTKDRDIPILFLTAKSMKEDRIHGFKIGADDYITKPFSMEELILRIQAVLKRVDKTITADERLEFLIGDFTYNSEDQILHHSKESQKLTFKEAELLRLLARQMNHLLPRETALQLIWGEDTFFNARSMDVYVSKLRKYLRHDPNVEIQNIHGQGFKLIVKENNPAN